jgi:methylated-DNA-[protein]-cysteine S-methyltransferase
LAIKFTENNLDRLPDKSNTVLRNVMHQLDEYFEKEREKFDLPLMPSGTEFQRNVWDALQHVPFGQTASYKEIAERVGDVKAVRAVGGANGKNPIPIIIPCHRIIGSDEHMVGYAGGLWRKEWLLKHEGILLI